MTVSAVALCVAHLGPAAVALCFSQPLETDVHEQTPALGVAPPLLVYFYVVVRVAWDFQTLSGCLRSLSLTHPLLPCLTNNAGAAAASVAPEFNRCP
ncbi:hypothetical protein MRX96_010456 [Rhipicephalus microplus]